MLVKTLTASSAILAALLALSAPVQAATPSFAPATASAATQAGLDRFYAARQGSPLWFEDGRPSPAATLLLETLRLASVDGYSDGPGVAAAAEAAMARAAADPRQVAAADRTLSQAWADYLRALRTPTAGMTYAHPAVSPRAQPIDRLLAEAAAAPDLAAHVRTVASVNPLYASLRAAALAQSASEGRIDPRLLTNLDRARGMQSRGRYVMVDAATSQLWMVEDGEVRDTMKVVVGKPSSETPMLASVIYHATVNPYWNLPPDLAQKLVAPHVVKQGVRYLREQRYEVLSGFEDDAVVVDPATVDWKAVAAGETKVRIRQLPGGRNAMGDIKFAFPNDLGIFLHDTPDKQLFADAGRKFSNGCVRLEDAPRLARFLMGSVPQPTSDAPEQTIALPTAVPVFITYLTAHAEGGQLSFVKDSYGRDRAGTLVATAR